jgi:hypothetical protein
MVKLLVKLSFMTIPSMTYHVLAVALFTTLLSCTTSVNTKEKYLNAYGDFIKEIKEDRHTFDEDEWAEKDKIFEEFSTSLYGQFENELGLIEKAKVAKYAFDYASTRGLNVLDRVVNDGDLEDTLEDFKSIWDDDLKDDFESAVTDLKDVWDNDLKDELETKLDELKIILEDEELQDQIKRRMDDIKDIVEDKELQGKVKDVVREVQEVLDVIEKKTKS